MGYHFMQFYWPEAFFYPCRASGPVLIFTPVIVTSSLLLSWHIPFNLKALILPHTIIWPECSAYLATMLQKIINFIGDVCWITAHYNIMMTSELWGAFLLELWGALLSESCVDLFFSKLWGYFFQSCGGHFFQSCGDIFVEAISFIIACVPKYLIFRPSACSAQWGLW